MSESNEGASKQVEIYTVLSQSTAICADNGLLLDVAVSETLDYSTHMSNLAHSNRESSVSGRTVAWHILLGLIAVGFVGLTDHLTGSEISFSIFYLVPILIATWFAERAVGLAMALSSAIAWFVFDRTAGSHYSQPLIPYWNASVRLAMFVGISYMLSVIRAASAADRDVARTDPLTGAKNSRYLIEIMEHEVERMRRDSRSLSVAYIDLDNFKRVNDERGHAVGDSLLRVASSVLQDNLRAMDLLVRIGGDEFVALMPETDAAEALSVAGRIQDRFRETMDRNDWPVTLSIGLLTADRPPQRADDLIRGADALMYEAKNAGKNAIRSGKF